MLGPLVDNGGPTETVALLARSPAVKVIPSGTVSCGIGIATDQRGVSRPIGTGCDVGAYEDASAPVQLANLFAAVAGVGPGKSLADKINRIQGHVAAHDTTHACSELNGFIAEVNAQAGKKISRTQAASLVSEAKGIRTILGC